MRWVIEPAAVAFSFDGYELTQEQIARVELELVAAFPGFGLRGAVTVPVGVTGSPGFQSFGLRGDIGLIPNTHRLFLVADGVVTIRGSALSLAVLGGIRVEASPAFATFGLASEIEVPLGMRSRVGFGPMTFAAFGTVPTAIVKGPSFPNFATDGEIFIPPTQAKVQPVFPAFTAIGEIVVPAWLRSAVSFQPFGLHGVMGMKNGLSGLSAFPPFEVEGTGIVLPAVNAAPTFPAFGLDGLLDSGVISIRCGMAFPEFGLSGLLQPTMYATGVMGFPTFAMSGAAGPESDSGTQRNPYIFIGVQ